ncbi:MAG: hypothetical protein HKN26_07140 [Acidimicrobiales bacterium]|nr:hypothetical protein [Acidimicrobiales bacterium]
MQHGVFEFGERRDGVWRRGLALMIVLVLVLGACGSSDDENADGATGVADGNSDTNDGGESPDPPPEPPSFGGGDFCDTMIEFDENDPLEGFSFFSDEYFDSLLSLINQTIDRAPREIKGSFEVVRDTFKKMRDTITDEDFNIMDPANEELLAELESEEFLQASEDIDRYLEEECGIDSGFGGVDPEQPGANPPTLDPGAIADLENMTPAQFYEQILGVDAETAECLVDELGDFEELGDDPNLFTQEFCGMTFPELMLQLGQGQ